MKNNENIKNEINIDHQNEISKNKIDSNDNIHINNHKNDVSLEEINNIKDKDQEIAKKNEIIDTLEKKLSKIKKNQYDILLRHQAEIENTLKRTQINIEKSHKFALEKFAIALLPIIDNLERTLEISSSLNENVNPILEGVQLTLKEFIKVMKLFNIICIDKNHVEFDPKVHEAMTVLDSKEFKSNQVIQVMQKGYMLHGRLLRPAMVSVSK
ncbi:MAG: nucleotide exchange factor GrpE [Wigglesworthia glossinidia]|nr:nucleotide exchange factor GrpE [Wigglesworthia glossinidia]